MSHDAALIELELPNRAEAGAVVRQALAALNGSLHLVSASCLRDAQLMASELVSNAFRHSGATTRPVRVAIVATDETLRVEVRDLGPGFDRAALDPPSEDVLGGWGLQLVGILAGTWGVETGDGTTVWFEVDRSRR